jgi:hypothetical protein
MAEGRPRTELQPSDVLCCGGAGDGNRTRLYSLGIVRETRSLASDLPVLLPAGVAS